MHLGRFAYDPTLWHEALMVFLPDGTRLAFKNYGRSDLTRGPAGGAQYLPPTVAWAATLRGLFCPGAAVFSPCENIIARAIYEHDTRIHRAHDIEILAYKV